MSGAMGTHADASASGAPAAAPRADAGGAATPGAAAPALHVDRLGKRYGDFTALSDVTLTVPPGARHALIGPNGAGKTTLIDLLSGLARPSAGTIRLGDDDITALPAERRARLGIVRTFQVNALFPLLTPFEAASLAVAERQGLGRVWWRPLARYGAIADEAHEWLARFGLAAHARTPTAALPYGRQRLLEIVLALAARPRILLLDEPAAGIPAGESAGLFDALGALPADMTVLLIEHDMDLVFRFARRITVLAGGAVLADGTPADIAADARVQEAYLGTSVPAAARHG
ncbi:ABC transporter ATP-binding protein [Pigmentiphaga soli]|uniref:ABC transporter ATP-binding protein n=1 Tax=Pigmentiphaga soli TaxID=1007095 RepID=A0ABP8H194_9BURK